MIPLAILALMSAPSAFPPEVQVMIVGTYHFANPKLDVVKTNIRDTLGAERQREIAAVVDALAKFRPTQICVEEPFGSAELQARYASYLKGTHVLTANETEQIGFRLGQRCGVKAMSPVDFRNDFDFESVMKFAASHGLEAWTSRVQTAMTKIGAAMQKLDAGFTVGEILGALNDERSLRMSNGFYMSVVDVNDGIEYPGADLVANWHARNLRIFANIRKSIASPKEKILVLVGAGHAPLLRQFVRDSADMVLVNLRRFLGNPPPAAVELACAG